MSGDGSESASPVSSAAESTCAKCDVGYLSDIPTAECVSDKENWKHSVAKHIRLHRKHLRKLLQIEGHIQGLCERIDQLPVHVPVSGEDLKRLSELPTNYGPSGNQVEDLLNIGKRAMEITHGLPQETRAKFLEAAVKAVVQTSEKL